MLPLLSWMSACSHPPQEVVWVAPDQSPLLLLRSDGSVTYVPAELEVGHLEGALLHTKSGGYELPVATSGVDHPLVVARPDGGIQLAHGGVVVAPGGKVLMDGKPFGEMKPGSPLGEGHAALLAAWTAFHAPLGVVASVWDGPAQVGVRAMPDGRMIEPGDEVCYPGPDCHPVLHVIGSWTREEVTVDGRTLVIAETVLPEDGGCRVQAGIEIVHFDGKKLTLERHTRRPTASLVALWSDPSCEDPMTRAALAGLSARLAGTSM